MRITIRSIQGVDYKVSTAPQRNIARILKRFSEIIQTIFPRCSSQTIQITSFQFRQWFISKIGWILRSTNISHPFRGGFPRKFNFGAATSTIPPLCPLLTDRILIEDVVQYAFKKIFFCPILQNSVNVYYGFDRLKLLY